MSKKESKEIGKDAYPSSKTPKKKSKEIIKEAYPSSGRPKKEKPKEKKREGKQYKMN